LLIDFEEKDDLEEFVLSKYSRDFSGVIKKGVYEARNLEYLKKNKEFKMKEFNN
jgi:hypothetical protein